jgi:hypothetical protein
MMILHISRADDFGDIFGVARINITDTCETEFKEQQMRKFL